MDPFLSLHRALQVFLICSSARYALRLLWPRLRLINLQLGAMFLRGTSLHPGAWIFIGSGLRKAMDIGAHRKKVYKDKPNAEDELWKRAFW